MSLPAPYKCPYCGEQVEASDEIRIKFWCENCYRGWPEEEDSATKDGTAKMSADKQKLRDVCVGALEKWGRDAQLTMAMEECAELIDAIAKHLRGRQSDLAGEVADVEIMCEQMRVIIGEDHVNAAKEKKVRRLRIRLSGK